MPSWSFQLEGQIFNRVEIIFVSHVDMKDKVLNPDPRVYRPVACLYIYGFESLWKFMIQHFIGEAQGVCGTPVIGCVMACCRRLLCSGLIPNWYSINMIILVAMILCRSTSSRSIDGPGRTSLFVQELT